MTTKDTKLHKGVESYIAFSSCAFVSLVVKFSDTAVPRRCSPHGQASVKYVLMRRVYFDNNASTPVLPEVFDAMRPCFGEHFGNASSIHHHGQETRAAVERARESVAALLGCRPAEVVFTSGGTEADNLAIAGLVRPGDHVVSSTIEHHAVLNSCKRLEERGIEVTYVPVDGRGLVDPNDIRRAIRPNTRLVTIMMANNETGVLQPVAEI